VTIAEDIARPHPECLHAAGRFARPGRICRRWSTGSKRWSIRKLRNAKRRWPARSMTLYRQVMRRPRWRKRATGGLAADCRLLRPFRSPSSPALPLVRQAHQLIGKSFFESDEHPGSHPDWEKAAFQIGGRPVLRIGRVSKLSKLPEVGHPRRKASPSSSRPGGSPQYRVESRGAGGIALLDQVQRVLPTRRALQPRVPMLCDRGARAICRAWISWAVLRDVLPKAALEDHRPPKKMRSAMYGRFSTVSGTEGCCCRCAPHLLPAFQTSRQWARVRLAELMRRGRPSGVPEVGHSN